MYVRGTTNHMPELLSPAFTLESIEFLELPTGHGPN